ncbi:MAG: LTA synthase family protein, partial [Acidobacteriota bacterium]|nr:LTA synthase family protein [Acidobacteriota bacterium]
PECRRDLGGIRHIGDYRNTRWARISTDASVNPKAASEAVRAVTREESVSFTEGLGTAALACGLAIRLRLHAVSPLPSAEPIRWLLGGAVDDLALLATGAVVFLLLFRNRPRAAAAAFATLAFLVSILTFLWSEALVYFGHPPRRTEFAIGWDPSFLAKSIDAGLVMRTALVLAVLVGAAAFATRRARRAPPRLAERGLAIVALSACALAALPLPVHLRLTSRHPLLVLPGLLRDPAAARSDGGAPSFRRLHAPGVSGPRVPAPAGLRAADAPQVPAGLRPNVVFLLLEGVRSEELGAWGGLKGLSPRLDDLARRGMRVDNAYSPGTHTPEGELALWYGLLASPHSLILTEEPDLPRGGLPEILARAGWKSFLWIHDGDQTFYRRDRFYAARGFRLIDGRDFDPNEPRTNWGYSDKALMRAAVRAFDRLEEPFAAMALTVSNHHPFQVPSDASTTFEPPETAHGGFVIAPGLSRALGLHTGPMLKTIHYTDEAVGLFFDLARSRPWFGRTIFVISGDHGLPIAPLGSTPTPHRFAALRHRVPLVFFSPLLAGGLTLEGPASLADVPATLLGLFGMKDSAGDGRDLFAPELAGRPVVAWDDEGRTVTAATRDFVYHATLDSDAGGKIQATEEALFSAGDAAGAADLAAREPEILARFRAGVLAWAASSP